jgi:hypothetical protein
MKTQKGMGVFSTILDLDTRRRWIISFTPRHLYPSTHWIRVRVDPAPFSRTWRRENSWPFWDSKSDRSVVLPIANRYINYSKKEKKEVLLGFEPGYPVRSFPLTNWPIPTLKLTDGNFQTRVEKPLKWSLSIIRISTNRKHNVSETDPVSETLCFLFVEIRMMDKVKKLNSNECYTPSSEPFRMYPKMKNAVFWDIKTRFRTSQNTHYVSTTETSWLMLCKIRGFQGADYEECRLLGCYDVWLL